MNNWKKDTRLDLKKKKRKDKIEAALAKNL